MLLVMGVPAVTNRKIGISSFFLVRITMFIQVHVQEIQELEMNIVSYCYSLITRRSGKMIVHVHFKMIFLTTFKILI